MIEIWKKNDGSVYNGGSIVMDGYRIFNPTERQLIMAGYKKVRGCAP